MFCHDKKYSSAPSNVVTPTGSEACNERRGECFNGYSDNSVCSSEYGSSWYSYETLPVVRPSARRAPSPTPEIAFKFMRYPPGSNIRDEVADDEQDDINTKQENSYEKVFKQTKDSAFSLVTSNVSNNLSEAAAVFLKERSDSKDQEQHRENHKSSTITSVSSQAEFPRVVKRSPVRIVKPKVFYPSAGNSTGYGVIQTKKSEDSAFDSFLSDWCSQQCCTGDVEASVMKAETPKKIFIDTKNIENRNIIKTHQRNISNGSVSSLARPEHDFNKVQMSAYTNRTSWYHRRQTRLFTTGRRRKRRTSPVFDNMSVVPESPTTVRTSSTEDDDSDDDSSYNHSPVPISPMAPTPVGADGIALQTSIDVKVAGSPVTVERSNLHPNKLMSENYITSPQSIFRNGTSSNIISPIKQDIGSFGNTSFEVPSVINVGDYEDDAASTCSWISRSHNIFRSEQKSHQSLKKHQQKISSSFSISSGSISLPVLICPAYKFTPIEIDCDDSYSFEEYEKQGENYDVDDEDIMQINHEYLNERNLTTHTGQSADGKLTDSCREHHEENRLSVPPHQSEIWSLYDLPLLFSRTVCDWAAHRVCQ